MGFDPLTLIMLAVLALLIIFMFYNSRKRQRTQAELREKIVPGAEVMTNFGLYGTLLSIDEDDNTALIETTPGTIVKVHRQAVARVVEESDTVHPDHDKLDETDEARAGDEQSGEPEYGERLDEPADVADEAKQEPGKKADD